MAARAFMEQVRTVMLQRRVRETQSRSEPAGAFQSLIAHIMGHERGAMSAWYSVMPTRAVGCTLVPSMTVARPLANSDALTSEPRTAVLDCSLRNTAILGLVRLGGQGLDVRWGNVCATPPTISA